MFDNFTDGFGDLSFQTARAGVKSDPGDVEATLDAIRREGLSGRQLRTARRLAQRNNLPATSDFDAVRLLRERGLDPFQRGSMLDMGDGTVAGPSGGSLVPGDKLQLPQTIKPIQVPSISEKVESDQLGALLRIQQDVATRRRRRLALLFARLFIFVGLPTLLAYWYFSSVATPLYMSRTEFQIQQQEAPSAGVGGLLAGAGFAAKPDSMAVQSYLQSREAMLRLDADVGFAEQFKGMDVDPLIRLEDHPTQEAIYKLYSRYVVISHDPTEGLVKMSVSAPSPEISVRWSDTLLNYAEEQVENLTARLREDAMADSRASYLEAQEAVLDAQQAVVDLQERYNILSSEAEASLLVGQISTLESQISIDKLGLSQMLSNPSPNMARVEPLRKRIATMEEEIRLLRIKMAQGSGDDLSLARIQGELMVAQSDVQTRQMILAQSLQSLESARIEANRQSRYLTPAVKPVAPDVPTYPRVFESTLVTMLILLGIYLMISMTIAIIREQVST